MGRTWRGGLARLAGVVGVSLWVGLAGGADASSQDVGFGPKLDTDTPIEITADQLDVFQDQQLAIFEGRVDAVQGELRLRSNKLKVYYDADTSRAQPTATGSSGNIRELVATGAVQIWNASEQARGNVATYDLKQRSIRMTGDVVLTKGANSLQGTTLLIDLNTGKSKLQGGKSTVSKPGRVRGIFEPPQ
ncbi:MAG: lipopolysaccharide transport periplasmic protein LptA [Pseudomonadota bacterium]